MVSFVCYRNKGILIIIVNLGVIVGLIILIGYVDIDMLNLIVLIEEFFLVKCFE